VNITLSVDDDVILKARRHADRLGISVNQLVRDYLEQLAGKPNAIRDADEFKRLSRTSQGNSKGRKFNRQDAHNAHERVR
jgi:hypothetical protein